MEIADLAVNFLITRVATLVSEQYKLIGGAKEDFIKLLGELEYLKAFLQDASRMDRNDKIWKQAVREVRLVVFKAETAVEKFVYEANKHLSGWLARKKVAEEIKDIRDKVQEIKTQYHDVFRSTVDNQTNTPPKAIQQNLAENDDVVGFDEEANTVIDRLVRGSKGLEAVPIIGMAGLGKSTLANKVFKDKKIIFEFFHRIWVNVSRNHVKKDVLLSILSSLKKRTYRHEGIPEEELQEEISSYLRIGRCLIVLDNVWDKSVKDYIYNVFPQNQNGHRVMVTTREQDVASYFNTNPHRLKFLTNDESWILLRNKVFGKESGPSEELNEPGETIATKCSGLPLAIVVIAGALVGKETKREWELVVQTIGDFLINPEDPQSCLEFVNMSYNLLSYDKKACFLYCATFPGSFVIPAWKLIRLWIAENFIPHDNILTPEAKAEHYLNELTRKNLVMVVERTSDGQIKTCRIHDMLYEFCKKEANDEYLFREIRPPLGQILTKLPDDPDTYRRICINSSDLTDILSLFQKDQTMELVKSFLCYGSHAPEMSQKAMKTLHKVFPMIRVIDVESIKFMLTNEFYKLVHLKYVSLSGDFNPLPKHFGKFSDLETLIINITARLDTFEIKADIWSLFKLRHLHTNTPTILPDPGGQTSNTGCCLQTLSTIAPESCTKKVFSRAHNLRKLGIRGDVVALVSRLSDLDELKQLENLTLKHTGQNTGEGIILPNLLDVFPNTLRKLTLSGTQLEWTEMTKLGQVKKLEVLKLKEYAFKGQYWGPEVCGFGELLVLWIERTDLRVWEASNVNFPKLKKLVLKSCKELEAIPAGLADIRNLQEMNLEDTKSAVQSARNVEKKLLTRASLGFKLSVFPPDNTGASKSTQSDT